MEVTGEAAIGDIILGIIIIIIIPAIVGAVVIGEVDMDGMAPLLIVREYMPEDITAAIIPRVRGAITI